MTVETRYDYNLPIIKSPKPAPNEQAHPWGHPGQCCKIHLIIRILLSPHFFFKKQWGYCNPLHPSITLSPPKPLDQIQPNLVCELLT